MTYSMDLRERVVRYVESGKTLTQAAQKYEVGKSTVHRWLHREKLTSTEVKRRRRKLDWKELEAHIRKHPDVTLKDRAEHFGVNPSAIWYAQKQMKITRKKKQFLYRERDHQQRG